MYTQNFSAPNSVPYHPHAPKMEDIRKQLGKVKNYFDQQDAPACSNNYKHHSEAQTHRKQATSDIETQKNIDWKFDESETIKMRAENSRLKERLKREKTFRRQLNTSLQKQAKLLQNLLSTMPFKVSRENSAQKGSRVEHQHKKYKRIRENIKHTQNSEQKSTQIAPRSQGLSTTATCIFRNQKPNQNKSTRNTSKHSNTSLYVSHSKNMRTPPKDYSQIEFQSDLGEHENNQIISDDELFHFLNTKLQQLMRKSQQEENRANKLKIRNQIGRVVSHINKIKKNLGSVQKIKEPKQNHFSSFTCKAISQSNKQTSHPHYIHPEKNIKRNLFENM